MPRSRLIQAVTSVLTRRSGTANAAAEGLDEQPLRVELLSVEQLERHARALAGWHQVDLRGGPDRLLRRLDENERLIFGTYEQIAAALPTTPRVTAAEEWLLDNFHLVQTQIRTTRRHLPRSYSRQLPRLLNGQMAGHPRVYDLALELISHVDGFVDHENLCRFVAAYQQVSPLTLGELWAVPIMLRLALVENLRRVAARLSWQRLHQEVADQWADRLLATARDKPDQLVVTLAEMVQAQPPLSSAFVPQFVRRLQGRQPALGHALTWVDQQLADQGRSVDQLSHAANQNEAADQIAIGNSINSLRGLSSMDWRHFVEAMSLVEHTLAQDPAGVHATSDFQTRDRCRHVIEDLARRTGQPELAIAEQALALARPHPIRPETDDIRRSHVGYYLLDDGCRQLEKALGVRPNWSRRLLPANGTTPLPLYLGAVGTLTALVTAILTTRAYVQGMGLVGACVLAAFAVVAGSQLAISLVNMLATRLVRPRTLPKLDFSKGIPEAHRTMVVVPTLIGSPRSIESLVANLEVTYLANRDPNLYFGLLTDFPDANVETLNDDESLRQQMVEAIDQLNRRYRADRPDIFFWLHRPRQWNASSGTWMAWERKRGKLEQFNRLILHGDATAFDQILGPVEFLRTIRYVITLDTDTRLARDAGHTLAGAMAHPLNRPRFHSHHQRVAGGYAILQPRVAAGLEGANRSEYANLLSGDAGMDPYTRQVSDVYQDLFAEGSFQGKGIYDVEAFDRAVHGRFPEHLILSHDLIESAFARSALISDVQVVEDYPSSYLADAARRHRWVRGDWQILAWVGPRIPDARGHWVANPLSALSRWKIFDNLRRTFVPGALVGLAVLGWLLQPHAAWAWTVLVLGIVILPTAVSSTLDLLRQRREVPLGLHLRSGLRRTFEQATRIVLELAFLPHDAHVQLDAAGRSLWRMGFNRRRLMEWRTSGDAERSARRDLLGHLRAMWIGPLLAMGVGVGIFLLGEIPALLAAAPLLGLWMAGPVLAWFVSRPTVPDRAELNLRQRHFLREAARLTWRYFEVFVGPDDHHLPPDNFREHPTERIDSRTSPTNMGLALLSNLAAHDFGYISASQLIQRTADAIGSMEQLERFRGHFYNWYDTRTLETLQPFYVSAVDSGNLVGHLLTLQSGLAELADRPVLPDRCFAGLADTHNLYLQTARGRGPLGAARPTPAAPTNLVHRIRRLGAELDQPVTSGRAALSLLREIGDEASEVRGLVEAETTTSTELRWWAAAFQDQSQSLAEDLAHLAPWLAMDGPDDGGRETTPLLPDDLRHLIEAVDGPLRLRDLARVESDHGRRVDQRIAQAEDGASPLDAPTLSWLKRFRRNLALGAERAAERLRQLDQLVQRCDELADADFRFLHNEDNDLLRIGFNVHDHRGDPSYYDLLASEARLASYVAIAQGQLSQDHWFALGRLLTVSEGHTALVSWSGSMFEYLMPLLVMPSYANTLLDRTCRAVVRRQMHYGRQRGVPWGVSESAYSVTDAHHNHQYQAFGVPGLGLKRGLSDDLVVAPYASALGLMVLPTEATRNLQRIAADGLAGPYGLYEAVDYTRSRLGRGQSCIPIRLYMAHHSGMTLLSLAHALLEQPMQKRFMRNPWMKAAELLLHERAPRDVEPVYPHAIEARSAETEDDAQPGSDIRFLATAATHAPQAHLLSNGRYHVMVTNSGGGSSRWEDTAVTRWQADGTLDACGQFCYLRDTESGDTWSATHQPTAAEPDRYEVIFSQGRAEFRRVDHEILSHLEISVSPENDVEIRRLTLTNQSRRKRRIELTSYGEVVLADPRADAAHPAFNKLFVQTKIIADRDGICATRRPRSPGESTPVLLHQMSVRGQTVGRTSFETDRCRFIGRGRTLAHPTALDSSAPLSDSEGSVLDPVVAIRRTVELKPDETATVDMITGIAENQEQALSQLGRYQDYHFANRVLEIAWTHSQLVLQDMGITESDAQLFSQLAGAVVYGDAAYRARPSILRSNRLGQSGLWKYGISGDWPIVLVIASNAREVMLIRQVLQAHAYWRRKGLKVDVVVINDDYSGYRQELQDRINALIHAGGSAAWVDKPGGVFVRSGDQMSSEDRTLLQSVARVVLTDTAGSLAEQADRQGRSRPSIGRLAPVRAAWPDEPAVAPEPREDLLFFNGIGGFTPDGREYVMNIGPDRRPPAPWCNVLANERLGTVVSESGSAYTWFENAHEYRLTPWANDPVADPSGEAIYLRDEHTGQSWSPTALPAPGSGNYRVRHGFGYSIFEHRNGGIFSELTTYVAVEDPIKFFVLKLRNDSGRARRISATGYFEWVLGESRDRTAAHVITELDPQTEAVFARNHYQADFPGRVAFAAFSESTRSLTGDRCEFIGRNGHLNQPEAMQRTHLSGRLGAALDPCAALQTTLELGPGQETQVVFMLGAGIHEDEARAVLQRYQGISGPRQALEAVWNFWKRTLGTVYVETPDKSVDVLVNGWLEYQTLASRVWGRSGYYQSGGAYGFRDQLQDCMALLHAAPTTYRRHLLRAAAHQFPEGDVQHWWHPPSGRGVRTRIRDDYLWLPFAAARYVSCTADTGVLEESVPFVNGRAVDANEESYYDLPQVTEQTASLYEHCVRAIEHGLQFGPHGLPLMGCGDWNDGMNEVGSEGTGESVWLGFFLYDVLQRFAPIALSRGDTAFAERCADQAELVRGNLEQHAWDGNWYLRAFFDDGTPLGSSANSECQIDAIPQAWSALTGAVDTQRSRQAMAAVSQRLIRRDIGIIQLFTPPFDQSDLEPGYVKGYVPGVRENGGQYTHAAVWTTMAFAALGEPEAAWECLRMINPVHHADTPQKVQTYKVEPYVMAADVYGVHPHEGRGGWTWYTGSSSWMFRLMVEQLLGLQLEVDHLRFAPCLPPDWTDFRMHYRFRETFYHIEVQAPTGHHNQVARVVIDDREQAGQRIHLVDDRVEHQVRVELE